MKKNNTSTDNYNRLFLIEKAFIINFTYGEDDVDSGILKDTFNSIIMLEMDLNMKIGLYGEFCDCFEENLQNEYKANNKAREEHRIRGNG